MSLTLSSKILKLHPHKFTELLKALHELFIISILHHRLSWVCFEHIDGFHILRVWEKFVYFWVCFDFIHKIVVHPLFPCLIKVLIHFHSLLNLFDFEWIFISYFEFRNFLLFGLVSFRASTWKKSFFEATEILFLFGFFNLLLNLCLIIFQGFLLLFKLFLILNMPGVDFCVILARLFIVGICCFMGNVDSFDFSFEVL